MTVELMTQNSDGSFGLGPVSSQLQGLNINSPRFRGLDTLRKDEWKAFDSVLVEVAQQRMVAVRDLISRGLTLNIPNAMGTTIFQWETVSDMPDASVSMDALTPADNARIDFNLQTIPLPIVHEDFFLNQRFLEASRSLGQPLDTTMLAQATLKVVQKLEDIVVNGIGASLKFGGATVTGYTTFADRIQKTDVTDWGLVATTGETILDETLTMIGLINAKKHYGPFVVYLTNRWYLNLLNDFKAGSDKSTLQRLLEIPSISEIKVSDNLAANNMIMVEMDRTVVDLLNGFAPRLLQWKTEGGILTNYKVMAIMVPRMKADSESQTGILHGTIA